MQSIKTKKIDSGFMRRATIFLIFIGLVTVLAILSKQFLTLQNINNVLRQVTLVIITGCGATLLMIAGKLDLSVGSTLAFSGVFLAYLVSNGMSIPLAVVLVLIMGVLIGLVNGIFVVFGKLTPVIATMGTMYMVRGITYIMCNGNTIHSNIPPSYSWLGTASIAGGFSVQILILIILVIVFIFIEKKTVLGKYSFAIGGNRTAAKLSGINVGLIEIVLYALTGVLAALAGIILSSRLGVGQPNVGTGFEFDVIVAVVLGGTSLAGGEGSVLGMVIGALIVGFLGNGLNLLDVQTFYQEVFKGAILVAAVLADNAIKSKMLKS